jgi:hypothetical protein
LRLRWHPPRTGTHSASWLSRSGVTYFCCITRSSARSSSARSSLSIPVSEFTYLLQRESDSHVTIALLFSVSGVSPHPAALHQPALLPIPRANWSIHLRHDSRLVNLMKLFMDDYIEAANPVLADGKIRLLCQRIADMAIIELNLALGPSQMYPSLVVCITTHPNVRYSLFFGQELIHSWFLCNTQHDERIPQDVGHQDVYLAPTTWAQVRRRRRPLPPGQLVAPIAHPAAPSASAGTSLPSLEQVKTEDIELSAQTALDASPRSTNDLDMSSSTLYASTLPFDHSLSHYSDHTGGGSDSCHAMSVIHPSQFFAPSPPSSSLSSSSLATASPEVIDDSLRKRRHPFSSPPRPPVKRQYSSMRRHEVPAPASLSNKQATKPKKVKGMAGFEWTDEPLTAPRYDVSVQHCLEARSRSGRL